MYQIGCLLSSYFTNLFGLNYAFLLEITYLFLLEITHFVMVSYVLDVERSAEDQAHVIRINNAVVWQEMREPYAIIIKPHLFTLHRKINQEILHHMEL